MAVQLPDWPAPAACRPSMVSSANHMTPAIAGPTQRINRMGSRWSFEVEMPLMRPEDARVWLSRLVQGQGDLCVMRVPQYDLDTSGQGTPRVKGAGQAGSLLIVDGVTPGYLVREGQFFTVLNKGQPFVHMCTEDVTANGDGEMTIKFGPMLRRWTDDNDLVEFAEPIAAGWIMPVGVGWSIDAARNIGLEFSLAESE